MNNETINNSTEISNNNYTQSNLEFINEHMTNIQNRIVRSKEVYQKNHNVNSIKDNNMLYTRMNDIMNKYHYVQNDLIDKLNSEANFIKYVGNKYDELEKKLKEEVKRI